MTGIVGSIALGGVVSKAKDIAASVPPKVWYALAIVAALLGGYLYHQHRVHHHDAALVASTTATVNAAWQKAFDEERDAARLWKQAFDLNAAAISNDERKIHDQAVADNAAAADAFRLRGPGAASAARCGSSDSAVLATRSGGRVETAPGVNAAGPSLPSTNGQSLPANVEWGWLVTRAQEHDDLLSEVQAWRNWYKRESAAWPTAVENK